MIHEIFPKRLDNSFAPRKPIDEDYVLMYRQNEALVFADETDRLHLPTFQQMKNYVPDIADYAKYLFSIDDEGFFLVSEDDVDVMLPKGFRLENVMSFRLFEPQYLALAGITGHQLYCWYRDMKYCGRCGSAMIDSTFERARVCPYCNNTQYPHISPAVIVAVDDGKRLLMARSKIHNYKPYALIAGFVEFGETFEETVKREVREEVGIEIKNIRYYKSQPWAFSCTEMVGFFAELDGDDTLTVDDAELKDAKWFPYDEIPENATHLSIAQELIDEAKARLVKKKNS